MYEAGTSAVHIEMVNQTSPSWDFGILWLVDVIYSHIGLSWYTLRVSRRRIRHRAQRGGLLPVESPELTLCCQAVQISQQRRELLLAHHYVAFSSRSAWIEGCFVPASSGVTCLKTVAQSGERRTHGNAWWSKTMCSRRKTVWPMWWTFSNCNPFQ